MRRAVLSVVLVARSAYADAPSDDAYSACLEQRHAIYVDASAIADLQMRARMLATMPTCTPGMVDDGSIAGAALEANAIAKRAAAQVGERDWRWSVTWEPTPILKRTVYVGFDVSPIPHLAVGFTGGIGRTYHVQVGSKYHWYYSDGTDAWRLLSFTEKQIGAHAAYYVRDVMKGLHVGADVTYQHFGDPTEGDRVTVQWISVEGLSVAAFGGFRTVTREGLTLEFQAGPMVTAIQTDNKMKINTDWHLDGTVHLHARFAGGWSF
jgi:hypothetical protein